MTTLSMTPDLPEISSRASDASGPEQQFCSNPGHAPTSLNPHCLTLLCFRNPTGGFRRLFQMSFRWIARSSRTAANTSDPFQHCTLGPIVHYIYWESQWVTRHFKVEGKTLQSDSDNYYFLAFFATFPDSSPPRPLLRRALTYSRLKGKHWILTMCVKLTDVDLQWLAVDLQP